MRAIERASDVRSSFVSTTGPTLKVMKAVPLDYLFRGDVMSPSDAPGNNSWSSTVQFIVE